MGEKEQAAQERRRKSVFKLKLGPNSKRLLSGAIAGAFSRTAVAPLETIHTHLMVSSHGHSLPEIFHWIITNEGWPGLFRGNAINVIRVAPSKAIEVAVGRRSELSVFGSDYNTKDGTGVRDYIHVQDLATGHSAALFKLFTTPNIGCTVYNLGIGKGTFVLEMVAAFEKAAQMKIPLRIMDRRPGDCSEVYAATEKAEKELGWKAQNGTEEMCRDQWNWASKNPFGYRPSHANGKGSKPIRNGGHAFRVSNATVVT